MARLVSERGNDLATADVRPHAWTGAALLGAGALLLLVAHRPATIALLGGVTLLLESALLWYLPSFAKRSLLGPPALALAGIVLFPAATLASALALWRPSVVVLAEALAALGLAHIALLVLSSVFFGKPWRSGIPFWRAGPHRAGDRAAALTLAVGLAFFLGAWILPGPLTASWLVGLVLLALGALAHLLPRSRAREPIAMLVFLGLGSAALARLLPAVPDQVLSVGLLLLSAGIIAGPATKRAGPRLRDAAFPLGGALVALVFALAGYAFALAAAAGLAVLGVLLLALPVVFNQRPASVFAPPAAILGATTPLAALLPSPVGAIVGAAAILFALATLAPLRHPRRTCPPGDAPRESG